MKIVSGSIVALGALMTIGQSSGQSSGQSAVRAQAQTSLPTSVIDLTHFAPYAPAARDGNFFVNPPYADAPELTPVETTPKGTIYRFTMESTDSKLFPGIAKNQPGVTVSYSRRVTLYVPSQYVPGKPAPFIVSQDSMGRGELPTILDNMIAQKRLPVIVAIFIDSGGGDAQGSERGLEYDTMSGRYAEFIEAEVLPRITRDYKVTFTRDPDARMTMGGSSGGSAALSMAWYHPEWYHRVLTYSGTYVNQQSPLNPETPRGAWEYHATLIPKIKRKPLRIWMEVGENDNRSHDDEGTYHNWVMANDRMAKALKARKYPYQFVFASAAGHVDGRVVRQTLPQALEWVWKGYQDRGK